MTKTNPAHVARCRCGAVEIGAWAEPIVVNACYCDDCQAAAQEIADSAPSARAASADGGTEFMLFRRDRIACHGSARSGHPETRLAEPSIDRHATCPPAGHQDLTVRKQRCVRVEAGTCDH